MSRQLPLAVKLPLLITAVLAVVLGVVYAVTHATLHRAAARTATERLGRATRQVAQVSATAVQANQVRYLRVANDSAIRRALRGSSASLAAVRSALERGATPTDSGMPVELWTADGRRVAYSGNDVRNVQINELDVHPELPRRIASTYDTTSRIASPDSMRVSPIYEDRGKIHLWFVQPIRDRDQTIGYITHQRRIAAGANTARVLQELSGDSVTLYYRNVDGSFWTSMTGEPFRKFTAIDSSLARDADGRELFYHESRIGSSPIMVGMYIPAASILARPKRTLGTILMLSIALMLGGAVAAWLIGRSVARPLAHVTHAAGSLAAGNYDVRVPETGDVEVRHLAQTFNRMAAELGASRRELEEQKRHAEAASTAKSDFLTTMSHELRTPLNAIGGYVELIEMGLRGPISELQRRDLERIRTSQQHLLGLISGVLDLARVEAGKVTYETSNIAVDPFLAGLDALIAPQAAAKAVRLDYIECPADLAVIGDREKLRQILLNLLSNAIRHTPAGGHVTLSAEHRGSRVAIIVEDTGPGIPADKREAIFEPFVQLDRSLTQTREGLGLGLAISRDLAHGMFGDLVVDAAATQGARFILTLRRGVVDERSLAVSGESPASSSR